MTLTPAAMEPLFPGRPADVERLEDLAARLLASSARLDGQVPPRGRPAIIRLLRVVNSYYSNLIEGNNTHPVDIERAMQEDYSGEPEKRDRQKEARIHTEVQELICQRLEEEPGAAVASEGFIRQIHQWFYARMPESRCWRKTDDDRVMQVVPGALRGTMVKVGQHLAPAPESLPMMLMRFAPAYDPSNMHGLRPVIAVAAAHHRLTWIHPFLDGNGRVARLFTDAWMQRIGFRGYGLWNVSRGLARRRDEYRERLAAADDARGGDLDGRGQLSNQGLADFCTFFLDVCLDQAEYMGGLLRLDGLAERVTKYVRLRSEGLALGPKGQPQPLKPEMSRLLEVALVRGEYPRGEAAEILGTSDRSARRLLGPLVAEGLLISDSEKSPVRLGYPAHAAPYFFPDLYPTLG